MIKILKFAKKWWYIMLIIVVLLVVQVYCDLALPEYTSDIVDVGIQKGGIEDGVLSKIRESEYDVLLSFMDDSSKGVMVEAYHLNSETGVYELSDGIDREIVENALLPAEMILQVLGSEDKSYVAMRELMFADLLAILPEKPQNRDEYLALIPEESRVAIAEQMYMGVMEQYSLMADQIGVTYVQAEYEAIGTDMNQYRLQYILKKGGIMLAISLVGMVVAITAGFFASRLAAKTSMNLRERIFSKVVSFSNNEMDRFSTASLITRSTNDVQQVQMVLTMIFRIVVFAPIMGVGGIIKVLETSASMTWIIAAAVLVILCVVILLLVIAMPKFKMMQSLVDRVNLVTREILSGILVVRAFSREKYEEKRFDNASRDLMKTQLFTNRAMAIMSPFMMFIMNAVAVVIIWVGANGIDEGTLQVGQLLAYITYTMQVVMSFLMITIVSVILPRASVAAGRIDEVLNTDVSVLDSNEAMELHEKLDGEVAFNHVNFRYPEAEENALTDVNFVAKPGETTAIIGSTGSGKSTLINLIPRLFDVTEGSVTIDGIDVRDMKQTDLRDNIGFVPQKGILFSGTIATNLSFGKEDATLAELEEAAKIAQADSFIGEKENGYDDDIAQGGDNVSGGQKQRLAIARAIVKRPSVYIFDDSFSALDYKTDIMLRKALKEKTAESTVIIVAQRISTILHAEKIVVLDEGKVVGVGTHEELMKECEVYAQIAGSQLSQKELAGTSRKGGM